MASNEKMIVAVSARALFDFEEENRAFRKHDPSAYCALQAACLEIPAQPGAAFPLVRKLLSFNAAGADEVEVAILSRNDPVTGLRVFASGSASRLVTTGHVPYGINNETCMVLH